MKSFHPTTTTYKQGAQTLPREYYTSETLFAKEVDNIFATHWVCVGRADRLTKPGDYFTVDIAGESLIVVVDSRGDYRAHFNVCRHRGTRVCPEPEGHFPAHMQCAYHAWTYSTDGKLVSAPHMHEVERFDKTKFGLFPAGIAVWEGFLFVNIAPKPQPFEKAFKPLIGRLSRFGLSGLKVGHTVTYDVRANWKLVFQNYNECLHCPTMHPELSMVLPYISGANDLIHGPYLGGYMEIRPPNESATLNGKAAGRLISDTIPKDDQKRAYYYSLFPNMLLSIHPDYANYYIIKPVAVDRTIVESAWMFHPHTLTAKKNNMKSAIDFWDLTNRQDWVIVERNQQGVTSRRYIPGPYSPRESIPAAWDRQYIKVLKP